MIQTSNTENKLFTTLMATFLFLVVVSFTSKDAHTQNVQERVGLVPVETSSMKYDIDPNIATVYIVGKKLPKMAS